MKPQCLILKTTSKRWVGLEPKMNAELQDVCPPPPHRPPSPLFPRIRCTLCPLRKFALFIRLKFSYPQCTHRMYNCTHHAMDTVHRIWTLLLTMYKVFRLCNLPPTLLTLRYLAFQEVCIRYKLESTPHTAEFQQICKYTCNTTHNNLQRVLQVDRFHLWTVAVLLGKHSSSTKAPQASLHKPKD